MNSLLLCPWDTPQFFFYSSNIPKFLFYSHIPTIIFALIFGIFVYKKSKKSLVGKLLLSIVVMFSIWSLIDLILWATNNPATVMFFWSNQVLIEPIIYATSLYLAYVFIFQKDLPFGKKILVMLPLLPLIVLLSTNYTLVGVNLSDCTAIEGFFAQYYTYIVESIYMISIIILHIYSSGNKSIDSYKKKEIKYFIVGITLFLISFSWGNVIGSLTSNWILAQAGLIGMPIFVGFLAYLIVKFKTFNTKVFGSQALVVSLLILVASILFIRDIKNVRIVILATIVFIFILGYQLIKGVKREIDQRQRLEQLRLKLEESNINLETANDKLKELDKLKTEFLSLASHQLRSPLTAIKGYSSMLVDGDFGAINDKAKEAAGRIFESSSNLAIVVEDFLSVSKIESGGMKYEMIDFDFTELATNMAKDLSITAEKKGLKLSYTDDKTGPYNVHGDKEKLRQVALNFIDNSIKYTKEGSIEVGLSHVGGKIRFAIKDTGMGMTPMIKATLFQKFARGEGGKVNSSGSGLGLYLAKEIAKAHNGQVGVDSPGPNLGSTFWLELDSVK